MEGLSKLLSEFYYDILGRIIPGGIGLFVFIKALDYHLKDVIDFLVGNFEPLSSSESFLILFLLSISYVIGFVVSPISSFLHTEFLARTFYKSYNVLYNSIKKIDNPYPDRMNSKLESEVLIANKNILPVKKSTYRRIVFLWYDFIKFNNKTLGDKLSKMRAEYRMLEGINAVMLIAVLLHLSIIMRPEFNITGLFILILLFIYSSYAAARSFRTYQFSVINNYILIKESE